MEDDFTPTQETDQSAVTWLMSEKTTRSTYHLLAWIKVRSKGKWQSPSLEVAEKLWRGLELMWA